MQKELAMTPFTADVRLAARTIHHLPDTAGLQLRCEEGTLWLTLDHDPRDIILEPGETFVADGHRRGIVYALRDARLLVRRVPAAAEQPRPAPRAALASPA
jgi:hypothetical protein